MTTRTLAEELRELDHPIAYRAASELDRLATLLGMVELQRDAANNTLENLQQYALADLRREKVELQTELDRLAAVEAGVRVHLRELEAEIARARKCKREYLLDFDWGRCAAMMATVSVLRAMLPKDKSDAQ